MVREQLLAMIDVVRPGLEIGALDTPMATRAMGPVEYVDHASTPDLRRLFEGSHIRLDDLVEVDHVWGDRSLSQCVGGRRYAYVLAAHVIEHVPDLFGWLSEIAEVLDDGGIAGFVVPDKRYTFDLLRRTSSVAELTDAYVRRLRRPGARQVFDHHFHFRDEAHRDAPDPQAIMANARLAEEGVYIDSHCWVFTPRTMAETLTFGAALVGLPFEIAALEPTAPHSNEFLLALRRLPDAMAPEARRTALQASLAALALPEEDVAPERSVLEDVVADLQRRLEAEQARRAAIETSTSWKLTAPLRAVTDALRGRG